MASLSNLSDFSRSFISEISVNTLSIEPSSRRISLLKKVVPSDRRVSLFLSLINSFLKFDLSLVKSFMFLFSGMT